MWLKYRLLALIERGLKQYCFNCLGSRAIFTHSAPIFIGTYLIGQTNIIVNVRIILNTSTKIIHNQSVHLHARLSQVSLIGLPFMSQYTSMGGEPIYCLTLLQ